MSCVDEAMPAEMAINKPGAQIANRERLFFYRNNFVRAKNGRLEIQKATDTVTVTVEQLAPHDWITAAELKRYDGRP